MTHPLPMMGAAMRSQRLPDYAEWLISGQRDLEIQDAASVDLLDSDWHAVTREIKAALDGYTGRLGIHAPFVHLSIAAADKKIRAVVQDRLKQALEFAAEIGGTHAVIHSPVVFLGTPFQPNSPDLNQPDLLKNLQETLAPVIEFAESIRCTLVLENIFDRNAGLWVAMVNHLHSDYVRCSLDTGHAFINHKLGAPPVDYWAREAGNLLGHIHIQDTDGYADRHWTPGEGNINWHSLMAVVSQLESKPRLILELMDQSAIKRGAQYFVDRGLAQ